MTPSLGAYCSCIPLISIKENWDPYSVSTSHLHLIGQYEIWTPKFLIFSVFWNPCLCNRSIFSLTIFLQIVIIFKDDGALGSTNTANCPKCLCWSLTLLGHSCPQVRVVSSVFFFFFKINILDMTGTQSQHWRWFSKKIFFCIYLVHEALGSMNMAKCLESPCWSLTCLGHGCLQVFVVYLFISYMARTWSPTQRRKN